MRKNILAISVLATMAFTAQAHDFDAETAKFKMMSATKKMDSAEGIQASLAFENALAQYNYGDTTVLLRIRSLTNKALSALGEQPAFLSSEIKRLEAALAAPKTTDAAKIATAKEYLTILKGTKPVYDALETESVDNMKRALALVEKVPTK